MTFSASGQFHTLGGIDELAERGAALIADDLEAPVYERLTKKPYDSIPWDRVHVYFGDERMVPCDDPESNYRMACETLLDRVDIPPWNVHRMAGEINVEAAARLYERDLRDLATETGDPVPRLDLILLGLGPDGHTASLFPGTPALQEHTRLVCSVSLPETSEGAKHAVSRLTLTYPVLNAARRVVFLVSGSDKAAALERVRAGDESAPATRVRPHDGDLIWLVAES